MNRDTPDPLSPPRAARVLIGLSATARDRDAVLGDLEEEFRTVILPDAGYRPARRWYWRQALRSVAHLVRIRIRTSNVTNRLSGLGAAVLAFTAALIAVAFVSSFFLADTTVVLSELGRFGWLVVPAVNVFGFLAAGYACERVSPGGGRGLISVAWLAVVLLLTTRFEGPVQMEWIVFGMAPGLPAAWFGSRLGSRERGVPAS